MFLRKSLSNGKIYLSFVQCYRDENRKLKQKTIQKIGYLEELKISSVLNKKQASLNIKYSLNDVMKLWFFLEFYIQLVKMKPIIIKISFLKSLIFL